MLGQNAHLLPDCNSFPPFNKQAKITDLPSAQTIRPLAFPLAAIGLVNIIGLVHCLPVWLQLIANSCSAVYLGSIMSAKMARISKNSPPHHRAANTNTSSSVNMKQAIRLPLISSLSLVSLYLCYRYLDPQTVNTIVLATFNLTTLISTTNLFVSAITEFSPTLQTVVFCIPAILKTILQTPSTEIELGYLVTLLAFSLPITLFYLTKHWLLNNCYALLFAVTAIRGIRIDSFKVGLVLMWLLFCYDVFWVYGSDIMVVVANNLDVPVKLLFPYIEEQSREMKFSMLGLGDLVFPATFISICIKFDIDSHMRKNPKTTQLQDIPLTYFQTGMGGYIAGIILTYLSLVAFGHAQPALFFLTPCCTLSVILLAAWKGSLFDSLWGYTTKLPVKQSSAMILN